MKFDKQCLAAPADRAFTIEFDNADSDQHNVAILPEHRAANALFRGEVFPGPATKTYQVSGLEAGNYHFHCDVHPDMQGDFIVR